MNTPAIQPKQAVQPKPASEHRYAETGAMQQESYRATSFFYLAPAGHDLERVLSADYFRAYASRPDLAANSRITVKFDSPRMWVELLVLEVDAFAAIVHTFLMRQYALPDYLTEPVEGAPGLSLGHAPSLKWFVMRNGTMVKAHFEKAADASAFARNFARQTEPLKS